MIPLRVSIAAAIAAGLLLLVIIELIRSRRLQERYALLWLLTGIVLLVFALWRGALVKVSDVVGINYPPSALFVMAAFFILLVLLHYSTVISELAAKNLALAQRLALLENRLRETFGFHGTPLRLVFRDRASAQPRRRSRRSPMAKPVRRSAPSRSRRSR